MRQNFWKTSFGYIIIIVVVGLAAYSFMLGHSFDMMDDQVSIVENSSIHSFDNLQEIFSSSFFLKGSYYRPLVSLSFMTEFHFFGINSFYYNLDNLILHLLCAVLVYYLINIILPYRILGFLVGLLFVLHPVQWEAVSNVSGRSILLCAVFFLSSFICYAKAFDKKKTFLWYGFSLGFFILALLSKETALTLPFILGSFELYRNSSKAKKPYFEILKNLFPFGVIVLGYLWLRQILKIGIMEGWNTPSELFFGIATFLRGMLSYLRILFIPYDLHYGRAIKYFDSVSDPQLLMSVGVFVLILILLFKQKKAIGQRTLFLFSWCFLTFLPLMQILPLKVQWGYAALGEHLLYLPSVGLFTLIILGFNKTFHYFHQKNIADKSVTRLAGITFYTLFFLITSQQNMLVAQEMSVFRQTLTYQPQDVRVRNAYALELVKHRKLLEAEEQLRILLAFEPGNLAARMNLGKTLCEQGRFEEGLEQYRLIPPIGPFKALAESNIKFAVKQLQKSFKK